MQEKPEYAEDVIDLRQIFQVIKKWRRVIIAITILAVVTSGVMSYYVIAPVYEARAMLLVTMPVTSQQAAPNRDDLETVISTVSRLPHMTMNSYVEQLTSDTMYSRVVNRLKLEEQGYSTKNLAGMVNTEVVKDSNIIMLKVQHTSPRLAADVANALGNEYLEYLSERNQDQMTRSTEFLLVQKEEIDRELTGALNRFRTLSSDPRSVDFLQKQIDSLTDNINSYQSNIDLAAAEVKQLEAGVDSLRERLIATPETIVINKTNTETGQQESAEQLNPSYTSLLDRLVDRESQLAEKTAHLGAMQVTASRLRGNLSSLQEELSTKQIDYQQLQNEISRLEETQKLLAQKVTQTQIASSIDMGGTSLLIASPALVPANPVKPNKNLNMAVALVLGLMVSVGLAFVLEFMDNTIKHPDDVQRHLGLPVLGSIPLYRGAENKTKRGFLGVRKK